MSVTLILGGARSGKSRHAQKLARELAAASQAAPIYLATSRDWDDDHRARIDRHRRERGPEWQTIEEPLAISTHRLTHSVIVLDCITLWLTNYFSDQQQDIERCLTLAQREFEQATRDETNTWLVVSNELGQSLHAPTPAGRKFVDLQGFMNQHIAERADAVVLMVAGIPWQIKGRPPAG